MLQTIDDLEVYVVYLATVPKLPITWATEEERPYAQALARAIYIRLIVEPGLYAIRVDGDTWQIFKVVDDSLEVV